MPQMVDPSDGLKSLQQQIKIDGVKLTPCEGHPDIQVHFDHPHGNLRVTYAKVVHGRVRSYAVFVNADPVDGVPCFGIGYAVPEKFRRQGLGAEIIEKSIDEMRRGLARNGVKKFYVEAVVGVSNVASIKLAEKTISPQSDRGGIDQYSGQPATFFLRLVEA